MSRERLRRALKARKPACRQAGAFEGIEG